MKKKILLIALFCVGCFIANAQEKEQIDFNKVPDLGQRIIKSYFPNANVTSSFKEKGKTKYAYWITLDDGTSIEMDKDGNWTNVVCGDEGIPTRMVPPKILMALKTLPGENKKLRSMSKDKKTQAYHIELLSGEQYDFDCYFKLISK